jgi:nucleoside-diphosphate-sugar epimerase
VLIGGTGFIGMHLAEHLVGLGYEVTLADLAEPARLPDGCRFVPADVRSRLAPEAFPPSPDLLVNLAAVHREPGHEQHEYFDTNVGGATEVVRLCEALGAENVVFVSSISVYGPSEDPSSEATPPRPTTAYGKSKLEAEQIHRAWRAVDPTRRRLTVVRPAVVFGPGEGGNFTRLGGALLRRRFVYPGRRDTLKASGYVIDLVRSIEFMQRQDSLDNLYNFAMQRTYTLEEICEAFSRAAGVKPPKLTLPLRPMLWAGSIGDRLGPVGRTLGLSKRRVEKLVSSTNVVATRLGEVGFDYEFDLDDALRDWLARNPSGQFV